MLRSILATGLVCAWTAFGTGGVARCGDLGSDHWAYRPPRRPELPPAAQTGTPIESWSRTPIDRFVWARLRDEGLVPSPEADAERRMRRVTFDLTGLPPTIEQLDAFLSDPAPDAFDRHVDRLLASPLYGERMAVDWLDLARYADTHGYHIDSHRDMWRWRDWVIDALNAGMPFDRFTIEQLAGDLLPGATRSQKIATGFHRNNMVNFEEGALPEEYLVEYVADRVATTSTVWMALTLSCARCHDHKHDPFSQRDYYRMFAFFNTVPELGLDGRQGNAVPVIEAPTDEQQWQLDRVACEIATLERERLDRVAEAEAQIPAWEERLRAGAAVPGTPPSDTLIHLPLDASDAQTVIERAARRQVTANGELVWIADTKRQSLLFDGTIVLTIADVANFDRSEPFSCGAWVYYGAKDDLPLISHLDPDTLRGYELALDRGRISFMMRSSKRTNTADGPNEVGWLRVVASAPLTANRWTHIFATYDGSGQAAGVRLYVHGRDASVEVAGDSVSGSTVNHEPLRIGGSGEKRMFRGMLDDVRLYARELNHDEVARLAGNDPIHEILSKTSDQRTSAEKQQLVHYFLEASDDGYQRLLAEAKAAHDRERTLRSSVSTTMVMQESATPRETWILARGDYRSPIERVAAGTPESLLPMGGTLPTNRLGLALWLVSPEHPLTARVAVNRYWETFFGVGLVRTSEDFGIRGELPSHPELLDWLASEFLYRDWDVKQLQRAIVTSATYRQASSANPEHRVRDPENRLMSRGPRLRLPAEAIRDMALSVSGLLVRRIGGSSVSPYQPGDLWREVSYDPSNYSAQVFKQSHGADLYRRSVYTFWKRAVPPPALEAFGAPDRETCLARRTRSNTPQQALVVMNDPTYVEAARVFAESIMSEGGSTPDQRLEWAFRCVTSRRPATHERALLHGVYARQLADYRADADAAIRLLSVGEHPWNRDFDPAELATWATVAGLLFGLDEAITR